MILGNVLGAIALGLVIWILTVHRWYWAVLSGTDLRNLSGMLFAGTRMHRKGCSGAQEYQSLPWGRNRILEHSRAIYGNARFSVEFPSRFWHVFSSPCWVEPDFWQGFSRGYSPLSTSLFPRIPSGKPTESLLGYLLGYLLGDFARGSTRTISETVRKSTLGHLGGARIAFLGLG